MNLVQLLPPPGRAWGVYTIPVHTTAASLIVTRRASENESWISQIFEIREVVKWHYTVDSKRTPNAWSVIHGRRESGQHSVQALRCLYVNSQQTATLQSSFITLLIYYMQKEAVQKRTLDMSHLPPCDIGVIVPGCTTTHRNLILIIIISDVRPWRI